MVKTKAKGSKAERDLLKMLWDDGWAVARIAGSGSMPLPCPDIFAGKNGRFLVIEVKVTAAKIQYFSKKEINELQEFAQRSHAEPWVAVKFDRKGWFLSPVTDLEQTATQSKLSLTRAEMLGFDLSEL